MKTFTLLLALFAAMMLSSCDPLLDCEQGSGEVITEQRAISDFTTIDAVGDIDLVVTQGETYNVSVEAQQSLLNNISTYNNGSALVISVNRCYSTSKRVVVYVTAPALRMIRTDNGCSAVSTSRLSASNFTVDMHSTGDVSLDVAADTLYSFIVGTGSLTMAVEADHLQLHSDGAGDATLSGTALSQIVSLNAKGNYKAAELACDSLYAQIRGSGSGYVNVAEFLKARISGSGNVFYTGEPTLDVTSTGSGQAIRN